MEDTTLEVAQDVLHTIPSIMRFVAGEMRQTRRSPKFIPAQFGLMESLAHQPCSLSELAKHRDVSLPTMSKSVNTLVERGWIRRVPSLHDRRTTRLELTPLGEQVLANIENQIEGRLAKRLRSLSSEDLKTLENGERILLTILAVDYPETTASLVTHATVIKDGKEVLKVYGSHSS